jgi:citrate lyase subunit beta/citryl-CoA lyase
VTDAARPRRSALHLPASNPRAIEKAGAPTVAAAFDLPENAGKGVLRVEGRMVERLHLAQARRLIAIAEAIAAHEAVREV